MIFPTKSQQQTNNNISKKQNTYDRIIKKFQMNNSNIKIKFIII